MSSPRLGLCRFIAVIITCLGSHGRVNIITIKPSRSALVVVAAYSKPLARQALEWIAITKLDCMAVVHILDDFLFLNSTKQGCMHDLNAFLTLCKDIGVPIAVDKTVAACTSITFMGICLNSDQMQASLPDDKMLKCRELLQLYSRKDSCTLRELQSLLGYLNFCCSIITS